MINTKILTPIPIVLEIIFTIAVPIPIVLEMIFPIAVPITIFNQRYFTNTYSSVLNRTSGPNSTHGSGL